MKIKTAKREEVGKWIGRAYLHLKLQTNLIRKSFAVTGISGSLIIDAILKEVKCNATKALEAEFGSLEEEDDDLFAQVCGCVHNEQDETEDIDM